jgi:two-component system OmpR family sensor kinase
MPSRALTRLRHPADWTLRTKLVVAVLTLFTLVTLIIGGLTIAVTQRYLSGQLIDDLRSVSARQDAVISSGQRPGPLGGDLDRDDGPRGIPGGAAQTLVLGLTPAGAIATDHHGNTLNSVVDRRGNLTTLTTAQIQDIVAARVGGEPERVTISGDIGSYLLVARTAADGTIRVTGLPTRGIDGVLRTLAQLILGGLALGLVGMWLGGSYLIRRSLAPLDRVAATAQRVSALRLDSGKVELPERVTLPEPTRTPRSGRSALALNTMLDNVESALHARGERDQVRQFVADASHELRTPLASIRGYAELSRRESEPVPRPSRTPSGGWSPRPCGCRCSSRTCCCSPGWMPGGPSSANPSTCRCSPSTPSVTRTPPPPTTLGTRPARGARRGAR